MRFWITLSILLALVLSACSTLDRTESAALADFTTTEVGISHYNLREVNPIGFLGTSLAKLYVIYVRRPTLSTEDRNTQDHITQSIWFGAAANNLAQYIYSVPFLIPPAVGVMVGFYVYQEWEPEPINTITNK